MVTDVTSPDVSGRKSEPAPAGAARSGTGPRLAVEQHFARVAVEQHFPSAGPGSVSRLVE